MLQVHLKEPKLKSVTYFAPEIEAGWDESVGVLSGLSAPYIGKWRVKGDGSIEAVRGSARELVPIQPFKTLQEFRNAWEEIVELYYGANESCGLHVHVSFRLPDAYAIWLEKDVIDKLHAMDEQIVGADQIARVRSRLSNSRYCRNVTRETLISLKASLTNGQILEVNRYQDVNWQAFRKYGSIEFRYLPSASKERLYPTVSAFVKAVDTITTQELQARGVELKPLIISVPDEPIIGGIELHV